LRADQSSERFQRAQRAYRKRMAVWRTVTESRRKALVKACTRHLDRFPSGSRSSEVFYLRGVALFELGSYSAARKDLERYVEQGAARAEIIAARKALVQSCRAMGDYRAALRFGGPDPDRLEEAGEIKRAITAARAAGMAEKVALWSLIGARFPGNVDIPRDASALVVEAGVSLPPERKVALRKVYEPKKVYFCSASSTKPAIYLLDPGGIVVAVNPRPDTLPFRLERILNSSNRTIVR